MCPENEENASEKVPMLTPREVAMLLHVHLNTIRRWSDQGLIRAYRINRRGDWRFSRDEIAHLLRQHEGVNTIRDNSSSPGDKFENSLRHLKSEHKALQKPVKLRSDAGDERQGLDRIFDGIVFDNGNRHFLPRI